MGKYGYNLKELGIIEMELGKLEAALENLDTFTMRIVMTFLES